MPEVKNINKFVFIFYHMRLNEILKNFSVTKVQKNSFIILMSYTRTFFFLLAL